MKEHLHQCPICNASHKCECHEHGGLLYQLFKACDLCFYKRMVSTPAEPRKAVAVLMILVLLAFPTLNARAQMAMERHSRLMVPMTASPAVFQQTANAMHRLRTKQLIGQDTAIDYAVAASSLQIAFAHMDETGMTDNIEKYILANPGRFTDFPAEPELQETFSKVSEDQRKAFVQYIQSNGLKSFHDLLLRGLDKAATLALLKEQNGFTTVTFPQGRTPSDPTDTDPCDSRYWARISFYSGWASLYLGVVGFVLGGPAGVALFWGALAVGGISTVSNPC